MIWFRNLNSEVQISLYSNKTMHPGMHLGRTWVGLFVNNSVTIKWGQKGKMTLFKSHRELLGHSKDESLPLW